MESPFFAGGHFHSHDWLNSLTMQNVHVLCYPLNDQHTAPTIGRQLSIIYDPNLVTNQASNKPNSTIPPYRLLEKFYDNHRKTSTQNSLLDIYSRQAIIDYVTREKIQISSQFLLNLIDDGAFYRLDLWQLCQNNDFTPDDVHRILDALTHHSSLFRSLTIGGNCWIYETGLICGPLKELLTGDLSGLQDLRLQQLSNDIDLIEILRACPNLRCLEIAQPSLTGRELNRICRRLKDSLDDVRLPVCSSLRSLHLPSSINENGLQSIIELFPNLLRLHCTPFEQLLDLLHDNSDNDKIIKILSKLESLSIMHPLSNDACERLTKICRNLKHLRIEVQDGMNLYRIFQNLRQLKRIELINSVSMPVNYTDSIQPALDEFGNKIESLSLELFDHINLIDLAKSCPCLKHLSAQWFNIITMPHLRYYRFFTPKHQYGFPQLEKLRLRPRPHQVLPEPVITFFLNHSKLLKHIELYSCSELTDTVIDSVGQSNPFKFLQTFIIRHGHNLTNDTLLRLLSKSSAAGSLVFHDCGLGLPEIPKQHTI